MSPMQLEVAAMSRARVAPSGVSINAIVWNAVSRIEATSSALACITTR